MLAFSGVSVFFVSSVGPSEGVKDIQEVSGPHSNILDRTEGKCAEDAFWTLKVESRLFVVDEKKKYRF